jgi:predicted ArsR family transcriptional regulator
MLWDERFFSTTRGQTLLALRRGSRSVDELARALGLADLSERLARALAMLDQLGGAASAEMRDGAVLIQSYSCPLVASVPAHPELCRMTEALLGQVLGAPVREQCDRSAPPRCCFEVTLTPGPRLQRAV